jgi:paraquat-inducible protein B
MSVKANPTLIGVFVVGALALLVAGILFFSKGKFFSETKEFVLYFDGAVSGLNVGSSVTFRGVKIGKVKNILLLFDKKKLTMKIPVIIEIEQKRMTETHGGFAMSEDKVLEELIKRGLRARLEMESLVTGQLMIELGFYPEAPIKLLHIDKDYPEIPTIPSSLEEISKTIERLPLQEITSKIQHMVDGVSQLVNSPEIIESIKILNETLKDIQHIVHNADQQLTPVMSYVTTTAREAEIVMKNVNLLVKNVHTLTTHANDLVKDSQGTVKKVNEIVYDVDDDLKILVSNIAEASQEADKTLVQIQKTLASVESVLSEESPMRYELINTLSELRIAVRSIRIMAEYLERHPDALIYGKGGKK